MTNYPITINGKSIMAKDVYRIYINGIHTQRAIEFISKSLDCDENIAKETLDDILHMVSLERNPPKLISREPLEQKIQVPISCPKCSSTAIVIGSRGFSIWTGFFGSGKTVNRCGNCGHRWYPKG